MNLYWFVFYLRTHKFHTQLTFKNAIILGISVGLIALTRLPSVVIAVFAVFYRYADYGSIFSKIRYFLAEKKLLVVTCIIVAIITFSPQIIYWKLTSGEFFLNSYANNPGEGMDWFTPYFSEVLFSYKGGWLIYTPMMFLSIFGFYYWIKHDRSTGISGLITFLLFFYVVSCWTTWWYPIRFGHRGMFDIYPILAISLGFFISFFKKKILYGVIGILILLNLFQTYQTHKGIIKGSAMTKAAYWSVFFQTQPLTQKQLDLREIDDAEMGAGPVNISKFKRLFKDSTSYEDLWISDKNPYAPGKNLILAEIKDVRHLLVRATWYYDGKEEQLRGKIFNTSTNYKGKTYFWRGNEYNAGNSTFDSIRKAVIFDYIAPNLRTKKDDVYVGLWAQSGDSLKIKGLKTEVYEWNPQ